MSVYPPPTSLTPSSSGGPSSPKSASPTNRRTPSIASSAGSAYTSNYFLESRSTTVTSVSSMSSRFGGSIKNPGNTQSAISPTNTSVIESPLSPSSTDTMSRIGNAYHKPSGTHGLEGSPPPLRPTSSNSPRHNSYYEGARSSSPSHFKFPPVPQSPPPPSSVPARARSPPVSQVKRLSQIREFNRRSINFADTGIADDLNAMKHSSVSHLRTLSQIGNGASKDFSETVAEEVTGMQGRKRLQRAQTESLSSWERATWMDKRRQYIQAYEYLCHIGEAKE